MADIAVHHADSGNGDFVYTVPTNIQYPAGLSSIASFGLPNGIQMPRSYQRLFEYFVVQILTSLSCHQSIHAELCRRVIPQTLASPHLLSASLAWAATVWASKGSSQLDGVNISVLRAHLLSTSVSLLRAILDRGQWNHTALTTCLILCLEDVYAGRRSMPTWRHHLQGAGALLKLDGSTGEQSEGSEPSRESSDFIYNLYLSLQTLAGVAGREGNNNIIAPDLGVGNDDSNDGVSSGYIDGFLGYSSNILRILREIQRLSISETHRSSKFFEAQALLAKVQNMISENQNHEPDVLIRSSISDQSRRDFVLCNRAFQQTTLILIYRKLHQLPSASVEVQSAVKSTISAVSGMKQDQQCSAWIVTAMPLFVAGCEACGWEDRNFVLDQFRKLEICVGSSQMLLAREALMGLWEVRAERRDVEGYLQSSQVLGEFRIFRDQ